MPRRPCGLLTVASALAFVLVAVLSARARSASDLVTVSVDRSKPPVFLRNQVYCISVDWGDTTFRQQRLVEYRWQQVSRAASRVNRSDAQYAVPGVYWFGDRICVAHWLLSVLALPLPVLALFRWVNRSKRYAGGQCVACGYDLRASGDRCSECGAPLPRREGPDSFPHADEVSGPSLRSGPDVGPGVAHQRTR